MRQGRIELHKLFSDALRNASAEEAPLLAWPMVCGGGVAKKTQAVSFQRGVLKVQVADKAWGAELEALADEYVKALNQLVTKKVSRIEFVAAGGDRVRSLRNKSS
jgi:Dna[CI] antecedent DciA-like protein